MTARPASRRRWVLITVGLLGAALLAVLLLPRTSPIQVGFLRGRVPFKTEYQVFRVTRLANGAKMIGSIDGWSTGVNRYPVGTVPWVLKAGGDRTICTRKYVFDQGPDEIQPPVADQFAEQGFAQESTGFVGDAELWIGRRSNGDCVVVSWYRPERGTRTLAIAFDTASTWMEKAEAKVRRLLHR